MKRPLAWSSLNQKEQNNLVSLNFIAQLRLCVRLNFQIHNYTLLSYAIINHCTALKLRKGFWISRTCRTGKFCEFEMLFCSVSQICTEIFHSTWTGLIVGRKRGKTRKPVHHSMNVFQPFHHKHSTCNPWQSCNEDLRRLSRSAY